MSGASLKLIANEPLPVVPVPTVQAFAVDTDSKKFDVCLTQMVALVVFAVVYPLVDAVAPQVIV